MHGPRRTRVPATAAFLTLLGAALTLWGLPAAASSGTPWGADYFPNVPLISHEGKTLRFFDDMIKGKVVAINFIYTNCPDACPLETAQLLQVKEILGDRVGKDVFMYSVTIDPERDTPEVLKAYAEKFQVGPGWLFLTGKEADITLLRRKLGLLSDADRPDDLESHSLSLVIGNQSTGRWQKASPYENPYVLATQIGSWLHNWKAPSGAQRDYAQAPELRQLSRGETLFRTRCASCHTIGADESVKSAKPRVGPDLFGVTRTRESAWLTRWIAEPDKMLAEKDPIAVELLAEYNNVPMPNLRLNPLEIEALLAYIEGETHRLEHLRHGGHHHSR